MKIKHKHNKKKNTLFLYECALREIASLVLKKKSEEAAILRLEVLSIFRKGTPLGDELALYQEILSTRGETSELCQKLITEARAQYNRLNKSSLDKARLDAIARLTKKSPNIFSHFVPNYRNIATIYQMFNSEMKIKDRVILEMKVVDMMKDPAIIEEETLIPKDDLVLKAFIQRFNTQYNDLLDEQKKMIQKFVFMFENRNLDFKIYLNEEIGRLKKVLGKYIEPFADKDPVRVRASELVSLLEEFSKKPSINENDIVFLLKIQSLAGDIGGQK